MKKNKFSRKISKLAHVSDWANFAESDNRYSDISSTYRILLKSDSSFLNSQVPFSDRVVAELFREYAAHHPLMKWGK